MRLLFIRHGDPDYEHDTLTEKGIREAICLADHIGTLKIDEAYQSPLGRAQRTAEYSLKKLGMTAETLDWLREFPATIDPNVSKEAHLAFPNELWRDEKADRYIPRIMWDVMPAYYGAHPELFDRNGWRESKLVGESNMVEIYDHVQKEFLTFLSERGYRKEGELFAAEANNETTIAFFCHYGITSVLMSILWNTSPFIPLQYMATAPTSVTELVTEERQKGIAIFRALRIGDTTHLTMAGEEPSFSARFCERFENEGERH